MKLTEKQIRAAVDWWGEALQAPTFKTLSREERSDPGSQPAAFAEMMAAAYAKPPSANKVDDFKNALAEILRADGGGWGLNVDYGPDAVLAQALTNADVSGGMLSLPWKTNMHFGEDGSVSVAKGYGQPYVVILEPDG